MHENKFGNQNKSSLCFHFSGYTVEKMNPKDGTWEKVTGFAPKDATEYEVPKLKEGEEYKFRVRAENAQVNLSLFIMIKMLN